VLVLPLTPLSLPPSLPYFSPLHPCIPPSLPSLPLSLSFSLSLYSCSTVWLRRGLARRSSTWWEWCATTASTTPPSSSRPRYASGCTSTTPTSKRWDTVWSPHAAARGGCAVLCSVRCLSSCAWEGSSDKNWAVCEFKWCMGSGGGCRWIRCLWFNPRLC